MQNEHSALIGTNLSLSGRNWRWRRGNMEIGDMNGTDLVTQLLLSRGIAPGDVERHRSPTLRDFMPNPSAFADMEKAAKRIARAILAREKITIYGDYDVDGATSAALMIRLIRMLGHDAGYYIPDRLLEGYGPTGEALVRLARDGSSLIVTVDCGAMAFEALEMAAQAGVDVIVVDHHKCSVELPRAHALVNPNRLDESEIGAAHGHLAAVGVAFLLGVALARELRGQGWFKERAEPDLFSLLDLVALGTVADVAALHGLNRAMVAQGLKVMARRENIGMAALMDASRLNRAPTSTDLGFALGPRVNAGGRVGEATLGVRLLTTGDADEARDIAAQLSRLNEERRGIEMAVQEAAQALVEAQHNRAVLVLSGAGWHPGVIGIVSGRIKEKTGKPTLVIAMEDGVGKGSGRSIPGVDLGAAILAAREHGFLVAGGGHAMAAGLTIAQDRLEAFAEWIDQHLAGDVGRAVGTRSLSVDLSVAPRGLSPDLVEQLESAGPFGMGWSSPRVGVGPVRMVKADVVGADHLRMIVRGDDGASFKAMAFRGAETAMGQELLNAGPGRKIWLVGRARIDDWGSRRAAELHVEDAAWAD